MKRDIAALTRTAFDLVILGGGITGAGVALDAALRGWRVALIDKNDFASGTSSASSKLIHGGLRYLEYGHFGLVYEALRERARLLHNAPHLVTPIPFILPFYQGQRIPAWRWRLGLTLYDLLAGRANLVRSRPCSARFLRAHAAGLRRTGLLGGAVYSDALMDDARLCLAVLQTAARHGAVLANYVEAVGFENYQGQLTGVWAQDRSKAFHGASPPGASPPGASPPGASPAVGSPFLIRGRVILNATGPWGDAVARLAGEDRGPYLQPTKGVHLIAPATALAQNHRTAYLLLHPRDGRVFFVIPWQGKTLIGTTDAFPDADADSLQVQTSEITYLLEGYNYHFQPGLRREEIMGTFAGLRPLLRTHPGEPSALSREFRLITSRSGLVTAAGGKYTTYRQMAETIVDSLGARVGRSRHGRTRRLLLEGAPAEPWPTYCQRSMREIQEHYPVAPDSALHLVQRYGNRVYEVLQQMGQTTDGFARLHPGEPDLRGEEAYQRTQEMALWPEDLLLRRSRIGMYRPELVQTATSR